jgi:hypothetical protein
MSFQWVIDNCEAISITSLKQASTTTSRDGTIRTTSRGYLPRQFEVQMPDGMPWDSNRAEILAAERLDRTTQTTFKINNAGQNWFIGYQGSYASLTGYGGAVVVGTIVQGSSSVTITSSGTLSSGFKFRAGDYIQLGASGNVYQVAADVAFNSNTITLDRPVREASATGVYIFVAQHCTFKVICTSFPKWNLFARNQIGWNGSFVFAEVLV